MTRQNKHLMELSDILNFTFTCKGCDASVSIPAARRAKDKGLDACPFCDEPWLTKKSNTAVLSFQQLQDSLRDFGEALKSFDGFSFRVEISSDPAASAKGD
jgi:hypothetical protein